MHHTTDIHTSAATPGHAQGGALAWLRRNLATLLAVCVVLVGVGLLVYPTFSDWWNSTRQSEVITSYASDVDAMRQEDIDSQIARALAYNAQVAADGVNWRHTQEQTAAYLEELTSPSRTVMGYINIEKIGVMLPIYHTTDESVLATSVGHLEGSSLPVGAASYSTSTNTVTDPADGSHCALSGHSGLPSARLFTDITKLAEGDTFQLIVLNHVLTYQVDQILTVLPDEMDALEVVPGRDLCTLITCTPYGINTHRLLVRGTRIATPAEAVEAIPVPETPWWEPWLAYWPFAVGALVAVVVLGLMRWRSGRQGDRGDRGDRGNDTEHPGLRGSEAPPRHLRALPRTT